MDESTKTLIRGSVKDFEEAIKKEDMRAAQDAYNNLGKILGVDVESIPMVQRKALGLTYAGAMFEADPVQKRTATRAALTLARTGMIQARYPRDAINQMDARIKSFETTLSNVDRSEVPLMSAIVIATESALQYLTPLIFTDGLGYIDVDHSFTPRSFVRHEEEQ